LRAKKTELPLKVGNKMRINGQTEETTADQPAIWEAEGEPWWLITGQESLDELRRKIIELSQDYSTRKTHLPGPFQIMGSLSYTSLTTLVGSLPRQACLDLFRMEQNHRSLSAAPRQGKNHGGTQ